MSPVSRSSWCAGSDEGLPQPLGGLPHPVWMDWPGSAAAARTLVPAASSDTEASFSLHLSSFLSALIMAH